MSYLVLARKWRPRTFDAVVGQAPVVRALVNALEQNRLHHAYLFTGTRGVGKTTLARIVAKCLNCEAGVTATPCNQCASCQEIDQGAFVDVLEIDAASRTKVEDTREILENVQYRPTRGRYKVYIIDEVHMLSGHSFNALLKTLEEPPEHVKFLLATTDLQRLPVTVLSRCLQFHLKNLTTELIADHLKHVLEKEGMTAEPAALHKLAVAANGSARDALSLLDQAIAYSNGQLGLAEIVAMLGGTDQELLLNLLEAVCAKDARNVLNIIQQIAEKTVDFSQALEELLTLLHRIALLQAVPDYADDGWELTDRLQKLAKQINSDDLQLYYQIALSGRRDLPYAPSSKSGFEMVLLRMLAFQPETRVNLEGVAKQAQPTAPVMRPAPAKTTNAAPITTDNWHQVLPQLKLQGLTSALASHCTVIQATPQEIHFSLDPKHAPLLTTDQENRLTKAISAYTGQLIKVKVSVNKPNTATPAQKQAAIRQEKHQQALKSLQQDPNIQELFSQFNGKIVTDSIEPV